VLVRLAVVGCGHVGLTTAACLAHIGHEVLGVDDDAEKIAVIARGEAPFHEPGLLELVREGLETGRLRVGTDAADAARHGEVVFVCVGTPTHPSGEADLAQVERVGRVVAKHLEGYAVVAEKSTVPVETGLWLRRLIESQRERPVEFDVASNPEFLREGQAVHDTLEPERIVVGADSPRALDTLRDVYRPIVDRTGCAFLATDLATAELIKHSSNAFLAMKISFANAVADVCERTGADVETVTHAMGLDPRIGPAFLKAGLGYGGECFPKDVRAYAHKAGQLGVDFGLLRETERGNTDRVRRFVERIREVTGGLHGRRVGVWGLAFKPDTDDLRNAPALAVVRRLQEEGAVVAAHDPVAMAAAKPALPDVTFAATSYEAASGADCLAICTEWHEYATADLERLHREMARPVVVDGRNLFRPADMAAAGFVYASVGRPVVRPSPSQALD
jgi:UDPglucose 6-dehydrogenase